MKIVIEWLWRLGLWKDSCWYCGNKLVTTGIKQERFKCLKKDCEFNREVEQ